VIPANNRTTCLTVALVLALLGGLLAVRGRDAGAASGGVGCACHPSKAEKQFVHRPVKDDECPSCHKPSDKKHPKYKKEAFTTVTRGKNSLCNDCHERKDTKKHVHPPVASGDCVDCHDPHQSDHKYQLREKSETLCLTCHDKAKLDRKYPHSPIVAGKCLGCHDPHQSDNKHLVRVEGKGLCFMCHNKAQFSGKVVHPPVASGDCSACHEPHGTQFPHLLKRKYPEEFYASFSKEEYALCFECHDSGALDEKLTGMATKFRNGNNNLHYIHVNKLEKGRSCKVCHDPHASNQSRLISSKVSGFGRWRIPVRYSTGGDGGTCVVGCHKPKSYNRVNAVQNP